MNTNMTGFIYFSKIFCIPVLWMKVVSALKGLINKISYHVIKTLMGIIGNSVTLVKVRRIIQAFSVPEHVYNLSENVYLAFLLIYSIHFSVWPAVTK